MLLLMCNANSDMMEAGHKKQLALRPVVHKIDQTNYASISF